VATDTSAHPTLLLLVGLAVLLMALLLLIGQGWARHVLAVLGVIAVILFALGGRWEAVVAFAALVWARWPCWLLRRTGTCRPELRKLPVGGRPCGRPIADR